jgi:hypothetical protein
MVKSEMVVLTERAKADAPDANAAVGWMQQLAAGAVLGEREREN